MNYNFDLALGGHFEFCQKKDVPLRGNFLQVIKVDIMNTS